MSCIVCKKANDSLTKWPSRQHAGFGACDAQICLPCYKGHNFCSECGGSGNFYTILGPNCDDFEDCPDCDQKGYVTRREAL